MCSHNNSSGLSSVLFDLIIYLEYNLSVLLYHSRMKCHNYDAEPLLLCEHTDTPKTYVTKKLLNSELEGKT